jgi:hypothetical protein
MKQKDYFRAFTLGSFSPPARAACRPENNITADKMRQLNLPACAVKLSEKNGRRYIYDPLRCKHVALTPEEWVRQHFVNYLITVGSYPKERIANEVAIRMNGTTRRCDTVVYDDYLQPLLIAEYKAPEIALTEEVFHQTSGYNSALKVPYLIVSNGLRHYCCQMDYVNMQCRFLKNIPTYADVK